MKKWEIRRDDGRYLIYYSFEDEDADTPDATGRPGEGVSACTDTPDENVDNRDHTRR